MSDQNELTSKAEVREILKKSSVPQGTPLSPGWSFDAYVVIMKVEDFLSIYQDKENDSVILSEKWKRVIDKLREGFLISFYYDCPLEDLTYIVMFKGDAIVEAGVNQ